MNRREFTLRVGLATAGLVTTASHLAANHTAGAGNGLRIHWTTTGGSRLFSDVVCDGESTVAGENGKLLIGECRLWNEDSGRTTKLSPEQPSAVHGPLRIKLEHELRNSGGSLGDDVLEATLTVRNVSDRSQQIEATFVTSASPSPRITDQHLYLPLNAAGLSGDNRFKELGVKEFLKDCNQVIDSPEFHCHYLEPQASYPNEVLTKALLLAPVVDIKQHSKLWHVALFTPSDLPARFCSTIGSDKQRIWQVGQVVTVPAGGIIQQRCWLMVHRGDAATAWSAFHRFGHREKHPSIGETVTTQPFRGFNRFMSGLLRSTAIIPAWAITFIRTANRGLPCKAISKDRLRCPSTQSRQESKPPEKPGPRPVFTCT